MGKHGFGEKTLWDWLDLLIVPAMLAIVAAGFAGAQAYAQHEAEDRRAVAQQEAEDRRAVAQQEAEEQRAQNQALQAYLEEMGTMLLDHDLRDSEGGDEVRNLARSRTFTVLGEIDADRKRSVMQFLYESQLIWKGETALDASPVTLGRGGDLSGATLSYLRLDKADLTNVNLQNADLFGAEMGDASLPGADLRGADLRYAQLYDANLQNTNLDGANLFNAYLKNARLGMAKNLTQEQIEQAIGSENTDLPDYIERPKAWSESHNVQLERLQAGR